MKKIIISILTVLVAITFIFTTAIKPTTVNASGESYELYFQEYNSGKTSFDNRADLESNLVGGYLYLNLQAKSLTGSDLNLSSLELNFTSTGPIGGIIGALSSKYTKSGPFGGEADYWDITSNSTLISLSLKDSIATPNVVVTTVGTFIITIALEYDASNTEQLFDYDMSYSDSSYFDSTTIQMAEADFLLNSFQVGDAGAEPSAELSNLEITGNSGDNYYNSIVSPDPATTNITLSYQDAQHALNIIPTFTSPTATASYVGNALSYNDGDIITINTSDTVGTTTVTDIYTINVSVISASTLNGLETITFNKGEMSPAFSSEVNNYTVNLDYSETDLTLEASVDPADLSTLNTTTISETYPVGTTTKTFVVTAEDGSVNTYSVDVVRADASPDSAISELYIDGNLIVSGDGTSYNYSVPELDSSFNLKVVSSSEFAKIEYKLSTDSSYTLLSSGVSTANVSIENDESLTYDIRVTAQDGTSTIYAANIHREASTDASLEELDIIEGVSTSALSPVSGEYNYILSNSGETTITVDATPADLATVRLLDPSNNEVAGGIIDISSLSESTHAYKVVVLAQDGVTEEIYPLNIIKKSSSKDIITIVAQDKLDGYNEFVFPDGDYNYNSSTNTYSYTYDYEYSNVRYVVTSSDLSVISGPGFIAGDNPNGGYFDVTLSDSSQTVTLTIEAEDGSSKQYSVTFRKLAADGTNTLDDLQVEGVTIDSFSPTKFSNYDRIILPGNTTSVYVEGLITADVNSVITYNGSTSKQISLTRGIVKTVNILVKAEDGTSNIYNIEIVAANEDNSITDIIFNNISYTFNSVQDVYDLSVDYDVTSTTISVTTPSDANSTIYGDGSKVLNEGNNTFKIYVESEAGIDGTEYTFNITRESARTDKILETLTVGTYGLTPNFLSTVYEYDVRVDNDVTEVVINGTVPSDNGSKIISGLGTYSLTSGQTKSVEVVVQAEDGSSQKYSVSILRANDINTFEEVTIDGIDYILSDFNASNSLTLPSVPFSDKELDITIVKTDDLSETTAPSLNVTGEWLLSTGDNVFTFYITSQAGTRGDTYKINVTQSAANTSNDLLTLEVLKGGNDLLVDLNEFDASKTNYSLRVDSDTTSININASVDPNNRSTITGNTGSIALSFETQVFTVTVTAEDGSTKDYDIEIVRKNDNKEITDISFTGHDTVNYVSTTTSYDLGNVAYTTPTLGLTVLLADTSAEIFVNDAKVAQNSTINLLEGLNTIEIYAVSEYGTKGTVYTYTVKRQAAKTDANLLNLEVLVGTEDLLVGALEFDESKLTYELRVDRSVESIEIKASVDSANLSSFTGAGVNALAVGSNQFSIKVTAEDTSISKTYLVTVTRENDVNDISNITVDGSSIGYDAAKFTYDLGDISFTVSSINIAVTLADSFAEVNLEGAQAVVDGVNTFEIYATSEFGTVGSTYTITCNKVPANTGNLLDDLQLIVEGTDVLTGDQKFVASKNSYEVRIDNDITEVEIIASAISADRSSVSGIGSKTLSSTNQTLDIIVTAENGDKNTYKITIIRQNNNNEITDIDFGADYSVVFAQATTSYDLGNVSYSVKELDLTVILADASAIIYVNDSIVSQSSKFSLVEGSNTIKIYAKSEYGTKGAVYTYTVTRQIAQTNADLLNLQVLEDGSNILISDQTFDSAKLTYELRVDRVTDQLEIKATVNPTNLSTVTGIGTKALAYGTNSFSVEVTAEDGATSKTYLITVVRANDDSEITDISVAGHTLTFDPLTTTYDLGTVDFTTTTIDLTVVLSDTNASVNLEGIQSLVDGANSIDIYATSEFGTKGTTYTITVNKQSANSDNLLSDLKLNVDGTDVLTGVQSFIDTKNNYEVRIDNNIDEVTIVATVDSADRSSVSGAGIKTLSTSTEILTVVVTAENGEKNTYQITIIRANDNSDITDITFAGYESVNYLSENSSYDLGNVASSVSSLNLAVLLADTSATIYVNDAIVSQNSVIELVEGSNSISIYAKSEYGTKSSVYTYTIVREVAQTLAELLNLEVLNGVENLLVGEDVFDSATTSYSVRVNHDVLSVNINAYLNPADEASFSGDTGNNPVIEGKNTFRIVVTAEDGTSKNTYLIEVIRANDDSSITNITADGNTISFDPLTETYTLDAVTFDVENIDFDVTLSDSFATVSLEGVQTLNEGTNTFEIFATSEFGTKGTVYTITIEKLSANSINLLDDLQIVVEGTDILVGDQIFDPLKTIYNLRVNNDIGSVEVIASVLAADRSTLNSSQLGIKSIVAGTNGSYNVTVTAEDGTEKIYEINISSENNNYNIDNIIVEDFETTVFDSTIYSYDLGNVPYSLNSLNFSIILEDTSATIRVNGQVSVSSIPNFILSEGVNTFVIQIESEFGEKGSEYTYIITKAAAQTDANLVSLEVIANSTNLLVGDLAFDADTLSYIIRVDRSVDTVKILAAIEPSTYATFTGAIGSKPLDIGENKFEIHVTAEDKTTSKTYSVKIYRNNDDAAITNIFVDGQSISFDPTTLIYKMDLYAFDVESVDITAVTSDDNATLNGTGTIVLKDGTLVVEVYAESDFGTKGQVYSIELERSSAYSNTGLASLEVYDGEGNLLSFDGGLYNPLIGAYKISLEDQSTITELDIQAVLLDATKQTIDGLINEQTLTVNADGTINQTFSITVEAESGDKKTYSITVLKGTNLSSDASINRVTLTDIEGNSYLTFNALNKVQSAVTIDYQTSIVTLNVIPNDQNAIVIGNGTTTINPDQTVTLKFQVIAQDGTTESYEYSVSVYREAPSDDNSLLSLEILDNSEDLLVDINEFSSTKYTYTLKLDRSVTLLDIKAIANNSGAIVTGDIGQVDLVAGLQQLKVFVTAEDDGQRTYFINIEVVNTDIEVISLSVDNYDLQFEASKLQYVMEDVPSTVESLNIKAIIPASSFGTLSGDLGVVSLVNGLNFFSVTATSEDESQTITYQIIVTRLEASSSNDLIDLYVTDGEYRLPFTDAVFNSDIQTYQIILDKTSQIESIEIFATAENGSTPTGTGHRILTAVVGVIKNDFPVTVTAENGEQKTYTITVIKQDSNDLSTDNEVKGVSISTSENDYPIDFNDEVTAQNPVLLEYTESSFVVEIKSQEKATIVGNDFYKIAAGETKTVSFHIVSESGIISEVYTIDVTRPFPDDNNTPERLYVLVDGETIDLDVNETYHILDIADTIGQIGIEADVTESQSVMGTGNKAVTSDNQKFYVVVIAEDGTPKVYTIEVNTQSDDATLKSIMVNGVEMFGHFVDNRLVLEEVLYEVESINILATASHPNETIITGNGDHTLEVGVNVIEVYATSELGTKGTVYEVEITRGAPSSDASLSNLVVTDNITEEVIPFDPVFNPETLKYTISLTLEDVIQEILIDGTANSPFIQSIDGEGFYTLKAASAETTEIFTVTVVAEDGSKREYEIHVTRAVDLNNDVTINTVSLFGEGNNYLGTDENASTVFSVSKYNYNISVPHSLKNVYLSVTNLNGAEVKGIGSYQLVNDVTTITFSLVSKSGTVETETYTITITKEPASSISLLDTLSVDGVLVQGFDPETFTYDLEVVYEDTESILIAATTVDSAATVSGNLGIINLSAGVNSINVTVTAEDGSTSTYQLRVSRLSSDNRLFDLDVDGYDMNYDFNQDRRSYEVNVPYTTSYVEVTASANSKANIVNDGIQYLEVGDNLYEVYVISENGMTGQVYQLHVIRSEVSSDSSLKSLVVKDALTDEVISFSPAFRSDTLDYIIVLDDTDTTESLINFGVANDFYALVGGNGYKVLKAETDGDYNNVFEITVRAQDDSTTTYTVSVYRNVVLSNSTAMEDLSLIGSDGVNYLGTENAITAFNPSTNEYVITVPYNVQSMTLNINAQTAKTYGTGTKQFVNDTLTFTSYIVSQSGTNFTDDYVIVVNRVSAIVDNTLKSLTINGDLVSEFDPEVTHYEIDIPYLSTNHIVFDALANDPSTEISGDIGTFNIENGQNVYSINVIAQNGAVNTYTVTVNYLNVNAYLDKLSVVNKDTEEAYPFTFNPDTFEYTVDVGKNTSEILITGEAQDQENAAIIGLGRYFVSENGETATINVIASDNVTILTYKINIIREELPSADASLKTLSVSGYPLSFNPDTTSYELSVGNSISSLDVTAIARDQNASVEILGAENISEGNNVVTIKVAAEDGTQTYYQLSVHKDVATNNFLTMLLIVSLLVWIITVLIILIKSTKERNNEKRKLIK